MHEIMFKTCLFAYKVEIFLRISFWWLVTLSFIFQKLALLQKPVLCGADGKISQEDEDSLFVLTKLTAILAESSLMNTTCDLTKFKSLTSLSYTRGSIVNIRPEHFVGLHQLTNLPWGLNPIVHFPNLCLPTKGKYGMYRVKTLLCDCSTRWLKFVKFSTVSHGVCAAPASLQDVNVKKWHADNFTCNAGNYLIYQNSPQ